MATNFGDTAAEQLAKTIIDNYDNPLQSSSIDVPAHVETLLQSLGASASDSGGKVTYYGADPITPDRLPYGSISAIALAAKAILIAKIWKERTGEGQDIHIDVRKSLRRLTPFLDGKWELVNGFPGRTDPYSPFSSTDSIRFMAAKLALTVGGQGRDRTGDLPLFGRGLPNVIDSADSVCGTRRSASRGLSTIRSDYRRVAGIKA